MELRTLEVKEKYVSSQAFYLIQLLKHKSACSVGFIRNRYPAKVPDFSLYKHDDSVRHPEHNTSSQLPEFVNPFPRSPIPPPSKCKFALGLTYKLTKIPEYTRGFCYLADFDVSRDAWEKLRTTLNTVVTQPEFDLPNFGTDGIWRRRIPGLTELIPGIPFCFQHVLGTRSNNVQTGYDLSHMETRVCFHTPYTASQYTGHKEVFGWFKILEINLFGDPELDEMPIWCNLKRNERSSDSVNPRRPYDGSFSIGHTVEECGRGLIVVASQTLGDRGMFRLNQITTYAERVSDFFLRRTLSPVEFEVWEEFGRMNNVPSIGLNKKQTSLQLNHSTGVERLGNVIGKVQGNLHPDPKDLVISYTCFVLIIRYPKGENI